MTKQHYYLSLSKVSPGMILAEDLLEKMGHVLLPAGVTLTAGMLKSIAQHDIQLLSILKTGDAASEPEEDTQQKLEKLERMFRHGPYPEPTSTLLEYMRNYRHAEEQ